MFRSQGQARPALLAALLVALCSPTLAHSDPTIDGVWSQLDVAVAHPSDRREHIAIYNRKDDTYLMFGGFGFSSSAPEYNFNEVWALSMSDPAAGWTHVAIPGNAPGPRKDVQWGYDVARNRLLIFGGYGQHYVGDPIYWQNDVWELKLNGQPQWHELSPIGTPPQGRLAGVAAFDPKRQRFIGFGGTAGAPVDTWSLDLHGQPEWSTIETNGQNPPGAYGMGSIYDPIRDRMVVFGGSNGADYYGSNNNIWALTLDDSPMWTQLYAADTNAPKPPPRRSMMTVYDPLRDRMIVYGGFDAVPWSDQFLADTWALSMSGPLAWDELTPGGTVPHGRDVGAAIYDPTHDRMVLFGGWGGTTLLGDTQFLTWGGSSTEAVVTGSASATMQGASLEWNVQQPTTSRTAVFRKTDATEWTSVATVDADASGTVTYTDTDIVPGEHYSYELVVSDQTGEFDAGQIALTIPMAVGVGNRTGTEFALHPVWPNPVGSRGVNVSFVLPNAGPARLDVLDVSGRVVASREVGGQGGAQNLKLDSRQFSSGIYFVRLMHASGTRTQRVAVMDR